MAWPERAEAHDDVPYFWSDQYDVKVQMLGVPADYDAIEVIEGYPDGWEFVAAYGRDGQTVAVLATIPIGCMVAATPSRNVPSFRPGGRISACAQIVERAAKATALMAA